MIYLLFCLTAILTPHPYGTTKVVGVGHLGYWEECFGIKLREKYVTVPALKQRHFVRS